MTAGSRNWEAAQANATVLLLKHQHSHRSWQARLVPLNFTVHQQRPPLPSEWMRLEATRSANHTAQSIGNNSPITALRSSHSPVQPQLQAAKQLNMEIAGAFPVRESARQTRKIKCFVSRHCPINKIKPCWAARPGHLQNYPFSLSATILLSKHKRSKPAPVLLDRQRSDVWQSTEILGWSLGLIFVLLPTPYANSKSVHHTPSSVCVCGYGWNLWKLLIFTQQRIGFPGIVPGSLPASSPVLDYDTGASINKHELSDCLGISCLSLSADTLRYTRKPFGWPTLVPVGQASVTFCHFWSFVSLSRTRPSCSLTPSSKTFCRTSGTN